VGEELADIGKKPYVIPVGGSNSTGSVGYVNAMVELDTQLKEMQIKPDAIVFATSSGGTQAGLALDGLLNLIQKGVFTKNQTILFWHTGGTPELFAWANQVETRG